MLILYQWNTNWLLRNMDLLSLWAKMVTNLVILIIYVLHYRKVSQHSFCFQASSSWTTAPIFFSIKLIACKVHIYSLHRLVSSIPKQGITWVLKAYKRAPYMRKCELFKNAMAGTCSIDVVNYNGLPKCTTKVVWKC